MAFADVRGEIAKIALCSSGLVEQRLSNARSAQLSAPAAAMPGLETTFAAVERMEARVIAFTPEAIQTRSQKAKIDPCLVLVVHFGPSGNRPALPQEKIPYSAEDLTPPQILPIARIGKPCPHIRAHAFPVTQVICCAERAIPRCVTLRRYILTSPVCVAVVVRRRSRLGCCS